MKVEINIDLDRIDYDSINEQIVERVKNMTPAEIFSEHYCTDNDVKEYIDYLLRKYSEDYIVNWYGSTNRTAEEKIGNIAKDLITEKVKKACDDFLSTISDEEMQKLVNDTFPNLFVQAMYDRIASMLSNYYHKKDFDTQALCRSIVQNEMAQKRIY